MDRSRGTLAAAVLGSSVVFLDSTVVNVALQRIGEELPSSVLGVLEGQSYVYNGYLLSLSALLILAGALADTFGRRRLFAIGLIGFGLASTLCGLAPSLETLIAFRVVQGACGALLVPGSLALITATLEGPALGRAFGVWAGASGAATVLGPFIGGVLVQSLSWRAAFLMNIPLILVALWLTHRHVTESRDEQAGRAFDWGGSALVAMAVGGLSFGAIYGQQHQWEGGVGQGALAVGVVASLAFVVHMARGSQPLVPLGLFRSRNFAVTNLSTFLVYGALYVTLYVLSIFSQGTLGYSAVAAGLIAIPGSFLLAVLSPTMGGLGTRFGPRRFMAAGPAIMALGLLWLLRMPPDSGAWALDPAYPATFIPPIGFLVDLLPAMLAFGLGLGVMVAPLTTALMTSVPPSQAGIGSAINNAVSRVGPQLVGALVFVAVTAVFYQGVGARVPGLDPGSPEIRREVAPLNRPGPTVTPEVARAARDASSDAFRLAMAIAAGLLLAGAAVNAVGIQARRVDLPEDAASQPEPG